MAFDITNNPAFSPANLLMLSGNILANPDFASGLGTGLQQMGTNVAAQQKEQAERMRQMQEQRQAANYLRQQNPGVDISNFTPGMINAAAENTLSKQLNPAKPEFKVLPDGRYGTWNGQTFTDLGKAQKPEELPSEYRDFQLQQTDPTYKAAKEEEQRLKDAPPIAKEYEWAKQQGFTGTPQEYQAWKANLSKTGMTVEYDPQNGFRMTQGNVDGNKPAKMTEQQSKDINFLTRAKKAEEQLAPLENELTSWAQKRLTGLPFDTGNYLQSKEYQQAQQAGREILAIILRKDTGAAVTPQEFEVYSKIYLPQPGEDKATIEAKRLSREAAIQGIQAGLGPLAPTDDAATPSATDGYNTTTTGTKWRVPGK